MEAVLRSYRDATDTLLDGNPQNLDNLDDDDDVVVGGGDESDIDIPIPITDFSFENSDRASDDESNDHNLDDGDVGPVTEAVTKNRCLA